MSTSRQSILNNITPGQIKKIHALIAQCGFDNDFYRGILWERYQVRSSKDLLNFQATLFIDSLVEFLTEHGSLKSKYAEKYKSLDGRTGFASVPQLALIESLWDKVSRMETPELKANALRGFLFKIAHVSDLRFLNKSGAGKVIIALRAMEKKLTVKGSSDEKNI